VTACAFRADARKIGLAGVEDEPSGLCDSTDLLPSLSGAVLRPPAPRQRVLSFRARPRIDAELRAGHRRTTPADRLHLGSLIDSRRGRGREVRCLAAGDLRLHPQLSPSRGSTKAEIRATPQGRERLLGSGEFSPCSVTLGEDTRGGAHLPRVSRARARLQGGSLASSGVVYPSTLESAPARR
jgi:hypothetical protein